MGFSPSRADPDIWMRRKGSHYEYIAVYVDDLAIAAKDPAEITETLQTTYGFKLKGVGPLEFHLGCDFARDNDGTLHFGPKRYIGKMLDAYEKMHNEKPKAANSPLEKNHHPEVDESPLLDEDGIKKYMSMIGALQWAVSLGRFDIITAVMTLSRFRAAPRQGHLDRAKRVYGYLQKFSSAAVRVRTGVPDYSDLPTTEYDWMHTVYGSVTEEIPKDAPEPLGKPVVVTTYVDANLYRDLITGPSLAFYIYLTEPRSTGLVSVKPRWRPLLTAPNLSLPELLRNRLSISGHPCAI